MLDGPANFFGPNGPADKRGETVLEEQCNFFMFNIMLSGLAADFRYQRTLTALRRLRPQDTDALFESTRLIFETIWASEVPSLLSSVDDVSTIARLAGGARFQGQCLDERRCAGQHP
jgi:hypothetical protein